MSTHSTEHTELTEVWLAELYERLRTAEAQAADEALSIIQRRVATQTAKHIARQIERYREHRRKQTN